MAENPGGEDTELIRILTELAPYRLEILWWEICCLLHDIGKLSGDFLKYRATWHSLPGGWGHDPHDHGWLDRDPILKEPAFTELRSFFEKPLLPRGFISGEVSVKNAVHHHVDPVDNLGRLLKAGDALDSRYDRNNPLTGCEQTDFQDPSQQKDWYRSNVFGYEGERTRVTPDLLDMARRALYRELQNVLRTSARPGSPPSIDEQTYRKIRDILRTYFEPAMSDTTRPNNDTSLWEHIYAVATLSKAYHIEWLLRGRDPNKDEIDFRQLRFHLWGVGFDTLRFISFGHRIGDVLGRRKLIQEFFDQVEDLLQFGIPLGNAMYRDDSCLVFLIPGMDLPLNFLEEHVTGIALDGSDGELVPHFVHTKEPVRATTHIVALLEELRSQAAIPVPHGAKKIAEHFQKAWSDVLAGKSQASVCPVCRLRPGNRRHERNVCRKCRDRRKGHTTLSGQTPFLDEVADENGRVALIVARIGLREWLDGRMVRTNLITELQGIRKTMTAIEATEDFKKQAQSDHWRVWFEGKHGIKDYDSLLEALTECSQGATQYHKATAFLGRQVVGSARLNDNAKSSREYWSEAYDDAITEHAFPAADLTPAVKLNLLCGKTPTPSTILDVWESTEEFLNGVAGGRSRLRETRERLTDSDSSLLSKIKELKRKERLYFEAQQLCAELRPSNWDSIDARLNGQSCQIVFDQDSKKFWVIGQQRRLKEVPLGICELEVIDKEFAAWKGRVKIQRAAENAFLPFREVLSSPDVLLLLVPAKLALEISQAIYEAFLQEFGKAYGRLPLSIGNIFFPHYLPMFSVLDAAWHMLDNFRSIQEGPWLAGPLCEDGHKAWLRLGNGAPDHHHAYVRTKKHLKDKSSYFETLVGPIVHFEELGDKESALIRPNIFDFIFLGASADRMKLHIEIPSQSRDAAASQEGASLEDFRSKMRRKSWTTAGPIFLEDVSRVNEIWNGLRTTITKSSLRNLEYLLVSHYEGWKANNADGAWSTMQGLADSGARLYWDDQTQPSLGTVLESVRDGIFFQTLNLHLRVLKSDWPKTEM